MNSLLLEGPGAAGGTSFNQVFRSFHGGLRASAASTNFAFETRTPTDLGEVKTVTLVDFSLFAGQGNYTGAGVTATSTQPEGRAPATTAFRVSNGPMAPSVRG